MHGLLVRVRLQTCLAEFAPDTTLLDATERYPEIRIVAAIDPHHARLDFARYTVCLGDVLREHGTSEAVRRVICALDGFLLGLERGDHNERTEDLFAVDAHAVSDICEDGRLDEEALAAGVLVRHAARGQGSALGLAGLDEGQHALVLCFCDLWTLEGRVFERITDGAGLGEVGLEFGDEFVVDAVLYQDT